MRHSHLDIYAPCPCGSGKKYKFCCLPKDLQEKAGHGLDSWLHPADCLDVGDRGPVVLDLEEGERLNKEGLRLLSRHRFAEAEKRFRASIAAAPLVPTAHNNLALVAFIQGRIEEAIRVQEFALRRIPIENVFGMNNLVQFYLTAGRVTEAEAVANDALRRQPRDVFALGKQCETLARLGRHRDILDAVERYRGDVDGVVNYFAGMAAANLGLYDRALDYLERVGPRDPHRDRAAKHIALVKAGCGPGTIEGNWPYFASQDIIPRDVFERLAKDAGDAGSAATGLLTNPVIVDLLAAFLNEGPGTERDVSTIELLGRMDHPRAAELLKRIAEGTFGGDDLRLSALRTLVEKGVWDSGSPHKVWVKGKWTDVKTQLYAITPEAASAPMPDGLLPLYEQATIAMRRGRWQKGEKLWREFLARAPAFHPAHHNLAAALIQQGRNAEAETHLRKAMELDPKYVFAPCTLAMLYMEENRTAEARALLDAVTVPDEVHPEAMAAYCAAQTQVAAVEGDLAKAVGWLDMAAAVDPDNRNVKKLKRLLKLPRLIEKNLSELRERLEEEKAQLRQRVLSKDSPLADCYGVYPQRQLVGMARAIGIDLEPSPQKPAVLAAVCAALENEETVRAIQRGLRPAETVALRDVADAGGRMDYETFTRAHGTDADDVLEWRDTQPQTVLGRLKCRGLLVEATVERRSTVFIPARIPFR